MNRPAFLTASGEAVNFSGTASGSGPLFAQPIDLLRQPDGDFLLMDSAVGRLFRIEQATGDRTIDALRTAGVRERDRP